MGSLAKLRQTAVHTFTSVIIHFILYVPSVVVVGLHGWLLPPSLIILCATVLYSEFLIHPLQRLLSNHRLRAKVSPVVRSEPGLVTVSGAVAGPGAGAGAGAVRAHQISHK